MEARASKLANIIESSTSSKAQTELENVSDEEEKFSAVVRPSHDSSRDRHDTRDFRDFTRSDRGSASTGPGAGGAASVNSAGGNIFPLKHTVALVLQEVVHRTIVVILHELIYHRILSASVALVKFSRIT